MNYDAEWPKQFAQLRENLWLPLRDIAVAIEHVGSTAVPGLAAKPVIDIDIVIPSRDELPSVIERLAQAGYVHRGNLGIEDRDAFGEPAGSPRHNLYVCPRDSVALRNHLTLRDHLRAHPADAAAYAALKKKLAGESPTDIDRYSASKTDFILSILAQYGFSADSLQAIRQVNQTLMRNDVSGSSQVS